MKTILLVAILLVIIIVLWSIGPRYVIKEAPKQPPSIPDDLDAYIREGESKTPDLKPEVQKEIIWAHEDKRTTEYAIVYLHGFSSSRKEVSPLFENVAKELGANLFFTRFKGHGSQTGELLNTVDQDDWMKDALEAREIGKRIGHKLIIAGTSHGGLLATWLAAQQSGAEPVMFILISPNYHPRDPRTNLLSAPWARQLLPLIYGSHRNWTAQNSGHDFFWNTRYPVHALFPMMAQVNYITATCPKKVTSPTLVFYSTEDSTVDPHLIEDVFEQFLSQKKLLVSIENPGDQDNHILAGDILSPYTTEEIEKTILEFIRSPENPDH